MLQMGIETRLRAQIEHFHRSSTQPLDLTPGFIRDGVWLAQWTAILETI